MAAHTVQLVNKIQPADTSVVVVVVVVVVVAAGSLQRRQLAQKVEVAADE